MTRRLPLAILTALVLVLGSCHANGTVLDVGSALTVSSYCVALGAGERRRFGRRYDDATEALPQTLGVTADGESAFVARVDGLVGGLRVASSSVEVMFPASTSSLTLSACAPHGTAATAFSQRDQLSAATQRLVFAHTGVEPAGEISLVGVGMGSGLIAFYRDGALVQSATPAVATQVDGLVALDIDGDCGDDLLVATDSGASAWTSQTDGSLVSSADRLSDSDAAKAIAAGDVDGDGWADLVVLGGVNTAHVLVSDRARGFGEPNLDPLDSNIDGASALALGDLDHDGVLDLVVGSSNGPLYWLKGSGHGTFTLNKTALPGTVQCNQVVLHDVDGDGDLDVIAAVNDTQPGLRVYTNQGNGTFLDASATFVPAVVDPIVTRVQLADVDGDCVEELLVAGSTTAPRILGLTSTAFVDRGTVGTVPGHDVGAVDLDGDGAPEVVVLAATVNVFSRTGPK